MVWIALNMGILGSLHCIGMCGPLSMMSLASRKNPGKLYLFSNALIYQLGRTMSYMMLGLVIGLIGTTFAIAGVQKLLSVLLGVFLIFIALSVSKWFSRLEQLTFFKEWNAYIMSLLGKYMAATQDKSIAVLGLLNGLIPCGLVYFALATAVAMPSIQDSIIFMMFFGLGTTPLMLAFSIFGNGLRLKFKLSYAKLLPIIAIFTGAILIWRGLELQVPENLQLLLSMKHPQMCH